MQKFLILLFSFIFAVPANGATIYKWLDEKGVVHFTDEYKRISPEFRSRVETKEFLEEIPSFNKMNDEIDSHEYARDYWRKQLDEATSNYEKAREELMEQGERLVWHRYGSKTQYQMFTEVLPAMSERLEAYRAQMIEAKTMLDQFSEEPRKKGDASGKRTDTPQTDIYGRDESWWKKEVRPWKEQLMDAKQGYEEASDAFVRQLERLGPFRWGGLSLTQYQMISSKLTILRSQMAQYQSQISKASDRLARLSKEASETRADPTWLE